MPPGNPLSCKISRLPDPAVQRFIEIVCRLDQQMMGPSARVGLERLQDPGMLDLATQAERQDDIPVGTALHRTDRGPDPGEAAAMPERDLRFPDLDLGRDKGKDPCLDHLIKRY